MPGQHPIAPEHVTLGQLYLLIQEQRHENAVLSQRVVDLTGEVAMARKETAEAKNQMAELLDAWRSGKGVLTFLKLLGAIATAFLAIWGVWSLMRGAPVQMPTP
jgi:hypothetical protein